MIDARHGRTDGAVLLAVVLALLTGSAAHAQLDLQAGLQHGMVSTLANPALFQDHVYSVQALSVMGAGASTLSLDDLGVVRGSSALNAAHALANVQPDNFALGELEVATLAVNYRRGIYQFGLSHALRNAVDAQLPGGLLRLGLQGNDALPVDGEPLDVWPAGHQTNYHALGGRFAVQLNRHVALGMRLNALFGVSALVLQDGSAEVLRRATDGPVAFAVDARHLQAGEGVDTLGSGRGVPLVDLGPVAGTGVGADLGVVVRPVERLELGLAATRFGSIRWKRQAHLYELRGEGTSAGWQGYALDQAVRPSYDIAVDTINDALRYTQVSATFASRLAPLYRAHARWRAGRGLDLTATWQGQRRNRLNQVVSVGAAYHLVSDRLHAGIVVGARNGELLYGGRVSTQWFGVEAYAMVDDIGALVSPATTRHGHARVGLNVALVKIGARDGWRQGWFDAEPARAPRGVVCPSYQ